MEENGIELPKFQKIAGLLSDDVKGDTLTLHDAILEINKSIISKVVILNKNKKNLYNEYYKILGHEFFYQKFM